MARNFPKKNSDHSKMAELYQKSRFFGLCSTIALTILMKFTVKAVLISIFQPAKTVCQKKNWFLIFLRSKLDHSVSVVIPWANMGLSMCQDTKMKLEVSQNQGLFKDQS